MPSFLCFIFIRVQYTIWQKKRLSGFNATGHLILRIQPFLSIVNADFDKNVKCEMFFYTLIHIQQQIVLLTNIRTWITYGNCVEIILSVIRNGIQKMTKWDSLELNEKFYPEHVWLFLYHYHHSSRKHNKLFCFVIYEFNKMSLKKKMILR